MRGVIGTLDWSACRTCYYGDDDGPCPNWQRAYYVDFAEDALYCDCFTVEADERERWVELREDAKREEGER